MREIGSEFWEVPQSKGQIYLDNSIFPESTQWFLSGRSALQAIVRELKIKHKTALGDCHTVAMPSWCCDSMVKPFVDVGIKVRFYPVYLDKYDLIQDIRYDCDVLFLMDYFGYTGPAPDLTGYSGVVIRDVTHSIFSTVYSDADYYFGSLRKWCGVWTGGYAWARNGHKISCESTSDDLGYIALREKAMQLKSDYIKGVDGISKSYLRIFNEAETVLENVGIVGAADRDIKVALKLDVDFIRNQRRKNAEILRQVFSDWLIFHEMKASDCPMFVPIIVPVGKRNELRQHLINNAIYCPVHWPMSKYHTGEYNGACDKHKMDGRSEKVYVNELSLVCDQRYTAEDMSRMVNAIKGFMKEVQ